MTVRRGVWLVVIVALLAALTCLPTTAATERRVAVGVTRSSDRSIAEYHAYVSQAGRAPAIWGVGTPWAGTNARFPAIDFLAQLDPATVPMVWWQPVDPADQTSPRFRYETIIQGRHDPYIRQFAADAKAYGRPVLLRFAHEMEGHWFPWSVDWFDNSPARFVGAWRHIWRIFRDVGAKNVRFVWSPNVPAQNVYPGDRYVDYVGFSAFNWGDRKRDRWRSLGSLVAAGVKALRPITRKPVILAEVGTAPVGKAGWIRKGYAAVHRRWPRVKAIVYFDVDATVYGYGHRDWSLDHPSRAMATYRRMVRHEAFRGRIR